MIFLLGGNALAQNKITYCNPISIPDYPIGQVGGKYVPGTVSKPGEFLWLLGRKEQYRELADVTVLWHENKWYMYPSVDMAWVSDNGGLSWQHHPLNQRYIGYAPTVVKHKDKFLLLAIGSPIYSADSPLGPFTSLGKIEGVGPANDPMLFSDNGRLFLYYNSGQDEISGVELDPDTPTRLIGKPIKLVTFEPNRFPWQCAGDFNEDTNTGWLEGAWLIKRNDTYYLTYSAAGTENRTYAVGCLTGKSPLGPFTHQRHNPIQRNTEGLITGPAHGSFVEGPGGSLWSFYTLRAGISHGWERRLGMDPAYISDDGELYVKPISSTPMKLTGTQAGAEPAGWLPLNENRQSTASSTASNLSTRLAVDDDLRTWWQPNADDKTPEYSSLLARNSIVHAIRIAWLDIGINTFKGIKPGPYQYRVELETSPDKWITVIDRTQSEDDLLIDYRELPPTKASRARLVVVGWPSGITPGVAEFTVFGEVGKK